MTTHGERIPLKRVYPDGPGAIMGPDGVQYNSEAGAFHSGVLGLCGCGSTEEVSTFLIRCLAAFRDGTFEDQPLEKITRMVVADPGIVAEFVAHVLDSKELLDHGSIVHGAWLTERGKQMLEIGPMKE